MRENIINKLTTALAPTYIDVIDESRLHAGHAGAKAGGESHFAVNIVSPTLNKLTKVAAHREIYKILATELKTGVHAIRIDLSAG